MIVTLENLLQIPRDDKKSFTVAEMFEGPTAAGPWTSIEIFALTPDADPREPQLRNLTTENALLADGWYYVLFSDADGDIQLPTEPIHSPVPSDHNYRPSVQDIGTLLRTRTLSTNGDHLGTFTSQTRPTAPQVVDLIDLAIGDVATAVGVTIPAAFSGQARYLTSLKTAMHIELSYFPEQVAGGKSVYAQFKELYDEGILALIAGIEAAGDDGVLDPGDLGSALSPAYGFPTNAGGLVGWDTVM